MLTKLGKVDILGSFDTISLTVLSLVHRLIIGLKVE